MTKGSLVVLVSLLRLQLRVAAIDYSSTVMSKLRDRLQYRHSNSYFMEETSPFINGMTETRRNILCNENVSKLFRRKSIGDSTQTTAIFRGLFGIVIREHFKKKKFIKMHSRSKIT